MSREAFEKWASDNGKFPKVIEMNAHGIYKLAGVQDRWMTWRAATAAAVPQWQPIETAPKDGAEILLGAADGSITVGYWSKYADRLVSDVDSSEWATHWMPLPTPPMGEQG